MARIIFSTLVMVACVFMIRVFLAMCAERGKGPCQVVHIVKDLRRRDESRWATEPRLGDTQGACQGMVTTRNSAA
jgi:hypothetical protein